MSNNHETIKFVVVINQVIENFQLVKLINLRKSCNYHSQSQ